MVKWFGWLGAAAGGILGGLIGSGTSLFAGFVLSTIGSGVGLYVGRRIGAHFQP